MSLRDGIFLHGNKDPAGTLQAHEGSLGKGGLMRTKLVTGGGTARTNFDDQVNLALGELGPARIIDIKFSLAAYPDLPSRNPCRHYAALILYEPLDASSPGKRADERSKRQ